jgi:RNA polymerase sigma factor (sigma-70 family)
MTTRVDDKELVEKCRAGNQQAFVELVDRYRDAVSGVTYHYLGNFEDAQDAAQEAFVSAYLHLTQLREPDKFGPWLRRIAATVCAGMLRRQGERTLPLEEDTMASRESAEDAYERAAARIVVQKALARLSEKTRLTVTLFHINGYSQAEIADFLEVPVSTVKSRLQRAKQQLREEMLTMVKDVLNEGKPDEEFTKKVQEAIRKGDEAAHAYAKGEALQHYDEAVAMLEQAQSDAEMQRLLMKTLIKRGYALPPTSFTFDVGEKIFERVLAIARALGDRRQEAEMYLTWSGNYSAKIRMAFGRQESFDNNRQNEEAEFNKLVGDALRIYEELGDNAGQGQCLKGFAQHHLSKGDIQQGVHYWEQALEKFKASGAREWIIEAEASLRVIQEIGAAPLQEHADEINSPLLLWGAGCSVFQQHEGKISYLPAPGYVSVGLCDGIRAFIFTDPFFHASLINPLLDMSVPVGGSWSDNFFSNTQEPNHVTMTIKSKSAELEVPAGKFNNCLLAEIVVHNNEKTGEASDLARQIDYGHFIGTRQAWYAPGVGLVQLHIQAADGTEALMRLREFHIDKPSTDYLPLAIGNSWTYEYASLPGQYNTKNKFEVVANAGDKWYLEEYQYALRK